MVATTLTLALAGGLSFGHPELAQLPFVAVALWGLLAYLELRQSGQLARFISPLMQLRLARRLPRGRRLLRLGLLLLAFGAGSVAMLRPQTPGELETVSSTQVAADLMVVLDVSRSMLAEDAAPSRLQRAKAEVLDLLSKLKGHRVGLVAFAGRAQVLCPLTPDYGFFRVVLERTDTRSIGRGGTRIGDGLRGALEAFGPPGGARLILLITDGEDLENSYPVEAAKEVRKAGVRVVAIGFGDERGSEIMLTDPKTGARSFLVDREGKVARSRLDGKMLRDIAVATEGAYIPAGVAALDLESIIREHIQPLVREQKNASVRAVPREHYPWLILITLLALIGAVRVGRGTSVSSLSGLSDSEEGREP
ncbi:MAG TPA: VWA domain-containing protein [Pseudomonadota bacterium]|nr:VWA domain-containing protein [Pseudomonadota bacterium]